MKRLLRPAKRFLERSGGRSGILMYHRVASERVDPWNLCVTPEHFDQQMSLLASARAHADLTDLARPMDRLHPGASRFAVTFDDGYIDNVMAALPVLERYDIPATFFIVPGAIGRPREFWWDGLARAILESPALPAALSLQVEGDPRRFDWTTDAAVENDLDPDWRADDSDASTPRQALFLDLWSFVVLLAPDAQDRAIDLILAWAGCDPTPPADRLPMDEETLARFAAHPLVRIGGHTVNHVSLTDYSPADQRAQIERGRQMLEDITATPIPCFSYPFGRHDAGTAAIVEDLGFHLACTSQEGSATVFSDRYRLPRLQAIDRDGDSFGRWLHDDHGLARGVA